jgi:hypothetical protein
MSSPDLLVMSESESVPAAEPGPSPAGAGATQKKGQERKKRNVSQKAKQPPFGPEKQTGGITTRIKGIGLRGARNDPPTVGKGVGLDEKLVAVCCLDTHRVLDNGAEDDTVDAELPGGGRELK